ncbi:hypothetical protein [Actinokineospora sp. NPDC004072]
MFKIEMLDYIPWPVAEDDDPRPLKAGRLIAGPFDEVFSVLLVFWNEADYWESWLDQLVRLNNGAERAYLINHVPVPSDRESIGGFPLYRFGDMVRMQDWPILAEDVQGEIDLACPEIAMDPYSSTDEDGLQLAEWEFPLADITEFLATQHLPKQSKRI